MGWSVLPTYTDGNVLTAAQLLAIAANINESAAAKATATGRIFVSTGANALAERVPTTVRVTGGAQGTATTTFGDNLTTVGPTISSLTTGTSAIFALSAFVSNPTAGQGGYMGCAVSGSSTIAADTTRALRFISSNASEIQKASYIGMFNGTLTAGSNTFKAQYANVNTGTATFDEREILVIPL
jgi:hypothetical protein